MSNPVGEVRALPQLKPTLFTRRVALLEPHGAPRLTPAGRQVLLGCASLLTEARRLRTEAQRYESDTLFTIVLRDLESHVHDAPSDDEGARLASIMEADSRLGDEIRALAFAEVARLCGAMSEQQCELRFIAQGPLLHIEAVTKGLGT